MLRRKIGFSSMLILVLFAVVVINCASGSKKLATKTTQKASETDYLGEGVVLAAFYMEDGGFSETRYYPAEILVPASEETNGEHQVISLVGDFDVAEEEKHWTDNVIIESHPAEKDELEEGMIVLYTETPEKEGLENARWNRAVVSSIDELYKSVVQLDYVWHLDKSDESDRELKVPVEQIRIIDLPRIEK